MAKQALHGRSIYKGCCILDVQYPDEEQVKVIEVYETEADPSDEVSVDDTPTLLDKDMHKGVTSIDNMSDIKEEIDVEDITKKEELLAPVNCVGMDNLGMHEVVKKQYKNCDELVGIDYVVLSENFSEISIEYIRTISANIGVVEQGEFELCVFDVSPKRPNCKKSTFDPGGVVREKFKLQGTMEEVTYLTSKFGMEERFSHRNISSLKVEGKLCLDRVAYGIIRSISISRIKFRIVIGIYDCSRRKWFVLDDFPPSGIGILTLINIFCNQSSIIEKEAEQHIESLELELRALAETCSGLRLELFEQQRHASAMQQKLEELKTSVSIEECVIQTGANAKQLVDSYKDVKTEPEKHSFEIQKNLAGQKTLKGTNGRGSPIALLKKEIVSALDSLKGVQVEMARLYDEKEEVCKAEKQSRESIESLFIPIVALGTSIENFEQEVKLKVEEVDPKLQQIEIPVQKTTEASAILAKFVEVQDTMKDANIMINELMIALDIYYVQNGSGDPSCYECNVIPLLAHDSEEISISKYGDHSLLSLLVLLLRKYQKENDFIKTGNFNLSSLVEGSLKKFAELEPRCMTKLQSLEPERANKLLQSLSRGDVNGSGSLSNSEKCKAKARERQAAILEKMRAHQSKFVASIGSTEDVGANDPECIINRKITWINVGKSIRGAELLGIDPYGQLFYSCCSYLLVSDPLGDESSFKYYDRNDMPTFFKALKSSEVVYCTLLVAISQLWDASSLIEGATSDLYSQNKVVCEDFPMMPLP